MINIRSFDGTDPLLRSGLSGCSVRVPTFQAESAEAPLRDIDLAFESVNAHLYVSFIVFDNHPVIQFIGSHNAGADTVLR
jgi:hypothetical protein